MKKFLFIDDNAELLESLQRCFTDNPNVMFAECHSVEEALQVIRKCKPDVIFLDHELTERGNEGLEIADSVQGIKIYSTTARSDLEPKYEKRGIERLGKPFDLAKLRFIIESQ